MLYCVGGGYWNISKSSKADSSVAASGDAAGAGAAAGGGKDEKWMISLSQEQQMNTDIRRTIFSVIMSSEVSE